jgi:hypothetical protein
MLRNFVSLLSDVVELPKSLVLLLLFTELRLQYVVLMTQLFVQLTLDNV